MERLTEKPSYGTQLQAQQRVIRAQFGDGYQQRAPDGINTAMRKWDVKFSRVSSAKAARVAEFLAARGSVEAFIWTPPAPHDTPDIFIVAPEGFTHSFDQWNNESIIVTLMRDFNPVARVAAVEIIAEADPDDASRMIVTMTCATAGAEIRYTADETDVPAKPTYSTGTIYTAPISLPLSYVRAMAWKDGYLDSGVTDYDGRATIGDGDVRITEDGNIRVTEDGNTRVIEDETPPEVTDARTTETGDTRTTEEGDDRILE